MVQLQYNLQIHLKLPGRGTKGMAIKKGFLDVRNVVNTDA